MNIQELAKKAGFKQRHNAPNEWWMLSPDIERFAALVLEEAAKVCEEKHINGNFKHDTRHECAVAIRALKGAK